MLSVDHSQLWTKIWLGEDSGIVLKSVKFKGDKVSAPGRDSLADEMAAFGNARGGRLVMGVRDDWRTQSLNPDQLDILVRHVREICTDSIRPPLEFEVYRVPAPEPSNGGALVVEIPESAAVHRSPGGHFGRQGDAKRQMDTVQIRRLTISRGLSDAASTDTQVVRDTGINSLAPDLWRRYASSKTDDPAEIALSKLKFIKTDSNGKLRATVGGVLLASVDPRKWLPNAWIM